jgi:hypothetical protein
MSYQQKYQTVLVEGMKSLRVPTTQQDQNNCTLTISEWILQVLDLQHHQLFDRVTQVKQDTIELQFLHTKFTTASQWSKDALTRIAQVVDITYLLTVFTDPDYTQHELQTSAAREPPTPPQLNFLPPPTRAWT